MHKKTLALTVGGLMASALSASTIAQTNENPFAFKEIGQASLLARAAVSSPAPTQPSGSGDQTPAPQSGDSATDKIPEGQCGGDKMPEGSCGGNMHPENGEHPQENNGNQ
jgi:uncharacterized low-complexity protein